MSKEKFPERIEIKVPCGTRDRLLRMLYIDPTALKTGMAGAGPKLRAWLLDHLAKAETGEGRDHGSDKPADVVINSVDGEESQVELALQLLTDPDEAVRYRMIQTLKICEDYRNRRRRKASGQEIETIPGIPKAVYASRL